MPKPKLRKTWPAKLEEQRATSPVWKFMQERYAAAGWVRFTEAAFELHGLVIGAEQRAALDVLEAAGLLKVEVRLTCPEGHTLWQGPRNLADGAVVEKSVEGCGSCSATFDEPLDVEDIGREVSWILVVGAGATPARPEPPTAQELAKALEAAGRALSSSIVLPRDPLNTLIRALLKRCPAEWLE